MTSPQNPSGQIATEILLENQYVKVWSMDLPPGQSSPWHHHKYWYVTVTTVPGSLRVEFPDGTSQCDTLQLGDVHFRAKDSIHRVTK